MRRESRSNWSLLLVFLAGCVVLGGVGAGIALADGEYDLTVPDAVDTPPRTVENPFNEEITDEIDAFAVIEPGDPIDVEVTAPEEESFSVDMYTEGGRENWGPSGTGSETVTFDKTDVEPGTYSLALDADGDLQAFHPVVISGYDVEFGMPDEDPESGGTLEIDDITVTPTELEGDPAGVEVVVWNEDHVEQIDATGSDGSYSASIDLDGLEPGEYNVHVAAVGEDEFRGRPEVLGLSESKPIDVVEAEDGGDSDSDSGGGTGAPGAGGGGAGTEPVDDEEPTDTNESDSNADGNETDVTPSEPTETVELLDEAPDEPGLRVSFENTTARAVTLSNESANGNVTVTDRSGPPADASPPAGSPIATVEITVPESERDAPATIELAVDADAVNDTERLVVERYHAENDSWTRLESSVVGTTATTITLTAETPGFSVFAVTEARSDSTAEGNETGNGTDSNPSSPSNDTDESTSDGSDDDVITPSDSSESTAGPDEQPEEQPGFGLVTAAIALLLAVTGWRYSLRLRSRNG